MAAFLLPALMALLAAAVLLVLIDSALRWWSAFTGLYAAPYAAPPQPDVAFRKGADCRRNMRAGSAAAFAMQHSPCRVAA